MGRKIWSGQKVKKMNRKTLANTIGPLPYVKHLREMKKVNDLAHSLGAWESAA